MNKNKILKTQGFSLIEIVISSAILVSVLVGLAALMGYIIRSNTQAETRTVATDLAQEGIDFFRYERQFLGYERLKNHLSNGTICLNDSELAHSDEIDTPFTIQTDCSEYILTTDRVSATFKREAEITVDENIEVVVRVYWLNDQGDEAQVDSTVVLQPY